MLLTKLVCVLYKCIRVLVPDSAETEQRDKTRKVLPGGIGLPWYTVPSCPQ